MVAPKNLRSPERSAPESSAVPSDGLSDPGEPSVIAMELDALGLAGQRAEAFAAGRAAGERAARRHGPVPDPVADAIAAIITNDPPVRVAG